MPRVQPGCKQRQHLFVAHHDSALARLTARSVQPVKAQLWVALSRSCGSRARLPEGYNVENSTRRICLAPSVTWIPESLTLMESAVNEMLTGSTSWSLPGSTVTFRDDWRAFECVNGSVKRPYCQARSRQERLGHCGIRDVEAGQHLHHGTTCCIQRSLGPTNWNLPGDGVGEDVIDGGVVGGQGGSRSAERVGRRGSGGRWPRRGAGRRCTGAGCWLVMAVATGDENCCREDHRKFAHGQSLIPNQFHRQVPDAGVAACYAYNSSILALTSWRSGRARAAIDSRSTSSRARS